MGLGMKSIIQDLGFKVRVRIHSDACAAIGMARRRGLGRVRHLDVEDLWIQTKVREGHVDLLKVAGNENPPDILTKYGSADLMNKMLLKLNLKSMEGRSSAAPELPPDLAIHCFRRAPLQFNASLSRNALLPMGAPLPGLDTG